MRVAAMLVATLLGACSASPTASDALPSDATPSPTGPRIESAAPAATADASAPPIGSVLPTHLGDLELHTFETGRDILLRLAERLGVDPGTLEFAFASEHGARFVQMTAVRVDGRSAKEVAEAWAEAAYTPDVADVEVSVETIGGEPVTVVSSASAGPRMGAFYLVERGEALVAIQAFDAIMAAEALAALP